MGRGACFRLFKQSAQISVQPNSRRNPAVREGAMSFSLPFIPFLSIFMPTHLCLFYPFPCCSLSSSSLSPSSQSYCKLELSQDLPSVMLSGTHSQWWGGGVMIFDVFLTASTLRCHVKALFFLFSEATMKLMPFQVTAKPSVVSQEAFWWEVSLSQLQKNAVSVTNCLLKAPNSQTNLENDKHSPLFCLIFLCF